MACVKHDTHGSTCLYGYLVFHAVNHCDSKGRESHMQMCLNTLLLCFFNTPLLFLPLVFDLSLCNYPQLFPMSVFITMSKYTPVFIVICL